MIPLSRLLQGGSFPGDSLRFGPRRRSGPVVVWHLTDRCGLRCRHCYAEATPEGERFVSLQEGFRCLETFAAWGAPAVLLSGGEPLESPHGRAFLERGAELGLSLAVSTNGTRVDDSWAEALAKRGAYVGVSLDGPQEIHDSFRGVPGAWNAAAAGLERLKRAGARCGLRVTLCRSTLPGVRDLLEWARGRVDRVCLYHFVPAGRGQEGECLSSEQTREVLEWLFSWVRREAGPLEVLTVDNATDGIALLGYVKRELPERFGEVRELLARQGGNQSGLRILSVRWDGLVSPDPFSFSHPLGRLDRDTGVLCPEGDLQERLKDRKPYLPPRCASCPGLPLCNGNLRARASGTGRGFWGEDPGCYLSGREIREILS